MNRKLQSNEPQPKSISDERRGSLELIASLLRGTPDWEYHLGPLCMEETIETLMDIVLATRGQLQFVSNRVGPDLLSTEVPDELGNGKVFKIHPHLSWDEEFMKRFDKLLKNILDALCSVHLDLLHTRGKEFSEGSEFLSREIRRAAGDFNTRGHDLSPKKDDPDLKEQYKRMLAIPLSRSLNCALERKETKFGPTLVDNRSNPHDENHFRTNWNREAMQPDSDLNKKYKARVTGPTSRIPPKD